MHSINFFLTLTSGVNHTSRASITTSTLPSIKLRKYSFFTSRRRHTIYWRDWSSDVCSSDLAGDRVRARVAGGLPRRPVGGAVRVRGGARGGGAGEIGRASCRERA